MPLHTSGKGKLFIVSAPSGTGKTTLCRKLAASIPNLRHSVSYTTRPKRKGEINNVHYSFVNEKSFKSMIIKGEFAEWAMVHGSLYGTSIKRLKELIRKGYDVILDIDTQGALQMKRLFKDATYIFLVPPSIKVLENRLKGRMSESAEAIKSRLTRAREEIASYKNYDYVVVNDYLKTAMQDMKSIIMAARLRTDRFDSRWIKKLK